MGMNKINEEDICKNCRFFYDGQRGMFCKLPKFEGQYTENCPKKKEVVRW